MSTSGQTFKPFFDNEGKKYVDEVLSGKKYVVINLDEMDQASRDLIIDDATNGGIKEVEDSLWHAVYASGAISIKQSDYDIGFVGECIPFIKVHEIASANIGKLIKVRGLVNRTHFIKPMATKIVFKCRECGHETPPIVQESPFVMTTPPKKCMGCEERTSYDEVPERSTYIDSQEFSIQEKHEDISGRTPQHINMIIFKKYLINRIYCGDYVEIVGTVKLLSTFRKGRKSRFSIPFLEVYTINKQSKDPESMEINVEEEKKIIELSKNPHIYSILMNNIAPSLFGMEKCKEACLLSLFGGVTKDKGDITERGNIHVLFVGDPSTGKSQLLRTVAKLAPRGMFSSGRGISGVGLTAALNKDELSGEWVLDAGVLVLADRGIACIDEMDKMRNEDRDNIHTAMADQIVPINKAGMNTILPARTAVIAAANPLLGRYDINKSVFENLKKFPPTLFNRFDLIFTLVDRPEEEFDVKVVRHILDEKEANFTVDRDLFKKYIAYAKRINPEISDEAKDKLEQYWLAMRRQMFSDGKEETHPIKYRQLKALIRLCEARARIMLKEKAGISDAECVIALFDQFLNDINFEMDEYEGAVPKNQKDKYIIIEDIVRNKQTELFNASGVPFEDIVKSATSKGIDGRDVAKIVAKMKNEGIIMESSVGCYRTVVP